MSVWCLCSRLILIASMWQTPLPRIDYHCAAPQTAAEFKHFARFHPASDLRHFQLGWHVHFVWAQRPEVPAPANVPGSDGTDQSGPLLCAAESSLKGSHQFEVGEMPLALFVRPVETNLSVDLDRQRDLAGRVRRPQTAALEICKCLCTWQC